MLWLSDHDGIPAAVCRPAGQWHSSRCCVALFPRPALTDLLIPFVFGHPRSGTSLLTAILDRHSKIAMMPETHLIRALHDRRGSSDHERLLILAWDRLRTRMGDLHFTPEAILAQFRSHPATPEGLLKALLVLWARRAGKPVVGEKTPAHLPFADRILDAIPGSRAILLVRDGRAVVEAMHRTTFHAETPLRQLVDGWIKAAEYCDRWLTRFPSRAVVVRFEDLARNPDATLRQLLGWLGLDFEANIFDAGPTQTFRRWEDYAKKEVREPIKPEKADKWREGELLLSTEQLGLLAPWLQRFGYPVRADIVPAQPSAQAVRPPVQPASPSHTSLVMVIGAHRSATASTAAWFSTHPGVAQVFRHSHPSLAIDWPISREEFLATVAQEMATRPDSSTVLCAAESYYLAHPALPRRIQTVAPDARLLVVLRHPVLRAFSHWLHAWRLGIESLPFDEAITVEEARLSGLEARLGAEENAVSFDHIHYSYTLQSRYGRHLERWYQVFPRDQILVLFLDELVQDYATQWERLCRHAGVEAVETSSYPLAGALAWPLSREEVLESRGARLLRTSLEGEIDLLEQVLHRAVPWRL